ncbi:FAST kinase domain-containing protein 2, mitochondrial isoform 1-T2 [Anomaloglossus baeobatrachus]|uniref:FAST kinase domain-containing protein 2, mitochondrial n=1 Tax=Anomaloglossus baeobatrachus TaxID=238106 RepID=UPI003F50327B
MHKKTLPSLLRTVRILQPCQCLLGVKIPSLMRNYTSRSGLLLHEIKPWTPASIATSIPIRFLHQRTSVNAEENNPVCGSSACSGQDHVREEYGQTERGPSLDGEEAKLQAAATGPPSKSCVDVLDAFINLHCRHELYCSVMNLFNILAYGKTLTLCEKRCISDHPNFSTLCYEVMKSAPSMSSRFLICGLHVFVTVDVNQKTRLIQTLLNALQHRLSTLNLDEISLLSTCLKMMKRDKSMDILHSGLSLLIELKCESVGDVPTLQRLMRIAPAHMRRKLEGKALQMIDKFTVTQCHNMFSVLADINYHSESLLDSCSHKIIGCLDELSCKRIVSLTGYCSKLSYFNENLLSAIGDNIMTSVYMWNIWQISIVLKNMAFLRFRCVPLLDYFADKILQESKSLRINYLVTTVRVFSILNHLPKGKENKFLETLNTALNIHMTAMRNKELLRTVYNFCLLGLVLPSPINNLLEDTSFISTLDNTEKAFLRHIRLCLLLESGTCPFSIDDMEKVEVNHSHSVLMCHTFLKSYFKDPALYQENMQFPSSYFIDFVLTVDREQNKLVHAGDSSWNMTRIAVLCCTANAFTLGSLHPVGKMALKMRHLKSLGFTVVVIPINQFIMMTEDKKVQFLEENIFRDLSCNQNSVLSNKTQQIEHHNENLI